MTIICVMCSNTAVIYTDCYSSSFNESQPRLQESPAKEAWDEDEKKLIIEGNQMPKGRPQSKATEWRGRISYKEL